MSHSFLQKPLTLKMSENYSLSWDNFQSGASETFKNLIDDKDFLDVTLACDDGSSVKAHKVILSSASSVLRTILIQNPHQHPLLYWSALAQAQAETSAVAKEAFIINKSFCTNQK